MKSNIVTSFSAGLLLATTACGIMYFSNKGEATNAQTENKKTEETAVAKTPTIDEMKTLLASSGYVVQTKEEIDKKDAATEDEWKKKVAEAEESAKKANSDNKDNDGKIVYRTMITVTNGMTSIDVGRALKSGKIIKESAFDFSRKVDKKGVAEYLKPGTYEVDSNMETDKIISTIFKKR
ncbi:aminodeoxychorismate lyase [Niallia sp. 03190]|uniref:aminodeoxychorismate lyase n=1 Tax=Niallia sp. 03190 TaxID=3458061 RepID=UPI00404429D2